MLPGVKCPTPSDAKSTLTNIMLTMLLANTAALQLQGGRRCVLSAGGESRGRLLMQEKKCAAASPPLP